MADNLSLVRELYQEIDRLKNRILELEDELIANKRKDKRKDKQSRFGKRDWMDSDDFRP